jgi:hypothetical protein
MAANKRKDLHSLEALLELILASDCSAMSEGTAVGPRFVKTKDIVVPSPLPSGVDEVFVLAGYVPEGEFDPVPEPELVIDDSKVVLDDVLCGTDGVCNFAVFESLRDEFDDSLLSFAGDSISVTFASEHSCLR